MLEWMHDPSIACFFRFDAMGMTEEKFLEYIRTANSDNNSKHFAIADENDEYLGTISLKNLLMYAKEANLHYNDRTLFDYCRMLGLSEKTQDYFGNDLIYYMTKEGILSQLD